jgi:hypothetical protein
VKRESVTRFFASDFFHESSSPQAREKALGSFQIFRKFEEKFASQGAPPVSTTLSANFTTGTAGVVDFFNLFIPYSMLIPVANNGNIIRLLTPSSELEL